MRSILTATAVFLAALSGPVRAEPVEPKSGLNLWLGLDLGILQSVADQRDEESTKLGALGGGKAMLSGFSPSLVFEGGVGWQMSRLKAPDAKAAESAELAQSGLVDREVVETRSGVGELAARYRRRSFEIGPAVQVLFGADTTYSPYLGRTDNTPNVLGGFGVYHTWFGETANQRLGLQLMTDLTIDERQVTATTLQYYLSIPIIKPKPEKKVVVKYREKRRYIVDAGVINFETGKFAIDESDLAYLEELGDFLEKSREKWSVIFITSHTDMRGSDELNTDLSRNRAEAVHEALKLPADLAERIKIKSRRSEEPVEAGDSQVAMARNRRVEVEIVGAIAVSSLKRSIALMRQKHQMPPTCEGEGCI